MLRCHTKGSTVNLFQCYLRLHTLILCLGSLWTVCLSVSLALDVRSPALCFNMIRTHIVPFMHQLSHLDRSRATMQRFERDTFAQHLRLSTTCAAATVLADAATCLWTDAFEASGEAESARTGWLAHERRWRTRSHVSSPPNTRVPKPKPLSHSNIRLRLHKPLPTTNHKP